MSPRLPHPLLAVQSDGRLAELAARGQERAFETLVKRHRAPLLRYCARLGVSETQAEDAVQQSFTKAWLALSRGAEVREPRAWLYRVVHNTAISAMRGAPDGEEPLPGSGVSSLLDPPAKLEQGLAARDALGHVAALPPMQREALVLAAIQGRSHEEVAGVLGVSDGAVRGLLHRARTTLRSAAAMLTPQGLIESLSRGSATLPATERGGEVALGGGMLGVAGAALKGSLLAAGAGLMLAGSIAIHAIRSHRAPRHMAVGAPAGGADRTQLATADPGAAVLLASTGQTGGARIELSPTGRSGASTRTGTPLRRHGRGATRGMPDGAAGRSGAAGTDDSGDSAASGARGLDIAPEAGRGGSERSRLDRSGSGASGDDGGSGPGRGEAGATTVPAASGRATDDTGAGSPPGATAEDAAPSPAVGTASSAVPTRSESAEAPPPQAAAEPAGAATQEHGENRGSRAD